VVQFEITPKAFANSQPRVGACDNPRTYETKRNSTLKALAQTALANAFSVELLFSVKPRVEATLGWNLPTPSAYSKPRVGATRVELANAYGVFLN
jgi:hypothetical protein